MSSVFLENADDYLAGGTSQACINPLFAAAAPPTLPYNSSGDDDKAKTTTSRVTLLHEAKDDENDATKTAVNVVQPAPLPRRRRRRRVVVAESDSTNSTDTPSSTAATRRGSSEKATLRLSDCLACSGCVTTTESMLVEQQSLSHFKTFQRSQTERGVMSVSLASWTDWIRHLYSPRDSVTMRLQDAQRQLAAFLAHEFYVSRIVDAGGEPLQTSLAAAAEEFVARYHRRHLDDDKTGTTKNSTSSADFPSWDTPSIALSPTETRFLVTDASTGATTPQIVTQAANGRDERLVQALSGTATSSLSPPLLPLLTSSCPGFVCFVEKATPSLVPLLCSVQSPMMLSSFSQKASWQVAVMPCHDKKLEAGRPTFQSRVDFVLTTRDVVQALEEAVLTSRQEDANDTSPVTPQEMRDYLQQHFHPQNVKCISDGKKEEQQMDVTNPILVTSCSPHATLAALSNNINNNNNNDAPANPTQFWSSGGYAEFVFRHACRVLFDYEPPPVLPWTPTRRGGAGAAAGGRSKKAAAAAARRRGDFWQVTLYRGLHGTYFVQNHDEEEATAVLRFAVANGFPSIQSLVQMLQQDHDDLPFHFVEVMACPSGCLNGNGQVPLSTESETPTEARRRVQEAQHVLKDFWTLPSSSTIGTHKDIYTQFHVVPPMELSTGLTAGVAVKDTQW